MPFAISHGVGALVQRSTVSASPFASHLCGALLVDDGVAITAAHCVANRNAESLAIRFGSPDLCARDAADAVVVEVEAIQIAEPISDDLAILRIAPSIGMAPAPRAAPAGHEMAVWATGWGSITEGGPFVCDLKKIALVIGSPQDCASGKPGESSVEFERKFFCATGRDGVNTCAGDSGSPVFELRDGQWSAVGLTLSGEGCHPTDQGIYLRLEPLTFD